MRYPTSTTYRIPHNAIQDGSGIVRYCKTWRSDFSCMCVNELALVCYFMSPEGNSRWWSLDDEPVKSRTISAGSAVVFVQWYGHDPNRIALQLRDRGLLTAVNPSTIDITTKKFGFYCGWYKKSWNKGGPVIIWICAAFQFNRRLFELAEVQLVDAILSLLELRKPIWGCRVTINKFVRLGPCLILSQKPSNASTVSGFSAPFFFLSLESSLQPDWACSPQ